MKLTKAQIKGLWRHRADSSSNPVFEGLMLETDEHGDPLAWSSNTHYLFETRPAGRPPSNLNGQIEVLHPDYFRGLRKEQDDYPAELYLDGRTTDRRAPDRSRIYWPEEHTSATVHFSNAHETRQGLKALYKLAQRTTSNPVIHLNVPRDGQVTYILDRSSAGLTATWQDAATTSRYQGGNVLPDKRSDDQQEKDPDGLERHAAFNPRYLADLLLTAKQLGASAPVLRIKDAASAAILDLNDEHNSRAVLMPIRL